MDPLPIPAPPAVPIAAPPWFFVSLLLLIFWLHLISMWMLVGGLIVGVVGLLRERGTDWAQNRTVRYMPVLMAFVINLGVPPLLMLQVLYAPFFFTSSILVAVPWITILVLLVLAYGLIYAAKYGAKTHWQAAGCLLVSTVSVLTISFIFSNNMTLMIKPEWWQSMYTYAANNGMALAPRLEEVLPRWLWILSPLFITGALLVRRSKWWGVLSGIISIVGLTLYWPFIPTEGESLLQALIAVDYVLAGAMLLLPLLAVRIPTSRFIEILFWGWVGLKGIAVVGVRHLIRLSFLEPVYPLADLQVHPAFDLITVFLIFMILGLAAMVWMFRAGRRELSI